MKNKDTKIDEIMLYQIFIFADDACQALQNYVQNHGLETQSKPFRKPKAATLSEREIITILVYYHYSGYKNFEYYYKQFVLTDLESYFPNAPSYSHFLTLENRVGVVLFILLQIRV